MPKGSKYNSYCIAVMSICFAVFHIYINHNIISAKVNLHNLHVLYTSSIYLCCIFKIVYIFFVNFIYKYRYILLRLFYDIIIIWQFSYFNKSNKLNKLIF